MQKKSYFLIQATPMNTVTLFPAAGNRVTKSVEIEITNIEFSSKLTLNPIVLQITNASGALNANGAAQTTVGIASVKEKELNFQGELVGQFENKKLGRFDITDAIDQDAFTLAIKVLNADGSLGAMSYDGEDDKISISFDIYRFY